jgi:hypothetical protein
MYGQGELGIQTCSARAGVAQTSLTYDTAASADGDCDVNFTTMTVPVLHSLNLAMMNWIARAQRDTAGSY